MQKIEELENSARRWYGGCVGMLLFSGEINTGITIRTVHLEDGVAKVRAGATLLCDSDPDAEERETRAKAETFINAVIGADDAKDKVAQIAITGQGKRVLFVDNRDSFVHTLGDYVRQTGAEVVTVRAARSRDGSGPRGLRDSQRVFAEFDPRSGLHFAGARYARGVRCTGVSQRMRAAQAAGFWRVSRIAGYRRSARRRA